MHFYKKGNERSHVRITLQQFFRVFINTCTVYITWLNFLLYEKWKPRLSEGLAEIVHLTISSVSYYLKSPAAKFASAKEKVASLITSPIKVLVYKIKRQHFKGRNFQFKQRLTPYSNRNISSTYFYNLFENFPKAHCQSIRFLFQKTVTLLSSLQPSFHQRQGPGTETMQFSSKFLI